MDIIVCIKQVPGSTDIKIDPATNTLIRDSADAVINPFDAHAVEAGVALKEQYGGSVKVLSMGPPQASEAIKQAISVGVDEGFLISDKEFAGADTLATSYTLSAAVRKMASYDLIICGKQTLDGDTGQVGPEMANHLGIPCTTFIRKIVEVKDGFMKAERLIEEGYEIVEFPLPAVISVVKELNEPRMPSIRGLMAAKKAEVPVWTAQDIEADKERIGLSGSPTWVVKTFTPVREKNNVIFEGEPEKQVSDLVARLRDEGIV
jgi:electron transfer flavoprotein beta subunit